MARKETVIIIDDFDGTTGAERISFALDGTGYEIDLSPDHAGEFRELFRMYANYARRAPAGNGRKPPVNRERTQAKRDKARNIRYWARTKAGRKALGLKPSYRIPERGRIPDGWESAYDAAKRRANAGRENPSLTERNL